MASGALKISITKFKIIGALSVALPELMSAWRDSSDALEITKC